MTPGDAGILEDLEILVDHGFRLIRMYDTGENTATASRLIRERGLPMKILLGIWLDAEFSNHEGCPWLDEPIPAEKLAASRIKNVKEIDRGIELANAYDDIVVAVNVGNEALDPEARQDADDDEDDFPDGIAQVPPEFPVHEKTPLDLPEDEHRYLSPSWRGSGTIRDSFDSAVIFAFNTSLARGFCRGRCRD